MFDRSPFTCEFFRYCAVLNQVVLVSCEQKSRQNILNYFSRNLRNEIICCRLNVMLLLWFLPAFAAMSLKSSEWNLKNSRKKVIDQTIFFFKKLTFRIAKLLVLFSNWSLL